MSFSWIGIALAIGFLLNLWEIKKNKQQRDN